MIKKHRQHRTLFTNKRVIIVVASISYLIVIAGGILLSQQGWNDYVANNNRRFDDAKTDIDTVILQNSFKPDASSADKLVVIAQAQAKLTDEVKSYCEVNTLIEWQKSIGQYSDKLSDCERQKEHLNQLLVSLDKITTYLTAGQALSGVISAANTKTNQNNQADKWDKIEAFWRQAVVDTAKIPDTDQFKATKTLASSSLTSVADAWKQISAANQAQNRQQFEEASSNLGVVYASLSKISDNSKAEVKKLAAGLNSSYKEVY